ncbi:hypothetical protein QLH51_15430 [Sphingomonas sp. 2R-10]|uniref:hypothetical protein n=1 Tax=Sphingomonas sp. 2R-10 TaxID=3045148 RepID=UPI000F7A8FAF|nr:hypothetical protein [Sphingomonas sp. 2R-10]MDJ0278189.1 hypothetical protein [Sphingomonas sp. 2R-10]
MAVARLGNEIAVEEDAEHDGVTPTIAGQADGRFLIAWEGPLIDVGDEGPRPYSDIYARTFDATGAVSGDIRVNSETRDPQFAPDAIARPDGSYVIAYDSGVEDQLEGTFLPHQRIAADGTLIGNEIFPPDYSYYKINPDTAAFTDGGYAIVAAEDEGEPYAAYLYSSQGTLEASFDFGFRIGGTASVTALSGDRFLLLWTGLDIPPGDEENSASRGLYAQVRARDGTPEGFTFLVTDFDDIGTRNASGIAPVVKALPNGNIVVAFAATRDDGVGGADIHVTIRDLDGQRFVPVNITAGKAGNQSAPDVAVLSDGRYVVTWTDSDASALGDASGSAIVAQLFYPDGTFDQPPFLVNTVTAGNQLSPTVTALGTDFVIAWTGPDGIAAQRFDADARSTPDSYIVTRAGTRDGSDAIDQTMTGGPQPTSFYIDVTAQSGTDRVEFASNDVIVTNRALLDPENDRRIEATPGTNIFDFDGAGPSSDAIVLSSTDTLRFLGTRVAAGGETLYAYGTYLGFGNVTEGTINNDTLRGTAGKDNFLFDTALGLGLGMDQIKNFGAGDRIVTTTRLADPDNDGRIRLNASDRLLFDTPAADGPSSLRIFNTNNRAISTLQYETSYDDGAGQTYYVYAAAGDLTPGQDLFF